jgi:long-chain acyl-CoA synthetase
VYGDSYESFLVAIVVPDDDYIKKWSSQNGNSLQITTSSGSNAKLRQVVLDDMIREGKKRGLMSFEQVKEVEFIKEPFTVENGLLTPTFKSRRYAIEKKYKELFQSIYKSINA